MVGTFISTTMNGEVHQTLHGWKKFEKSAMNAKAPGRESIDLDNAQNRRSMGSSIRP
jgi:hypothetical protein